MGVFLSYSVCTNNFPGVMKGIIDKYAQLHSEHEENCNETAHWYAVDTCASLLSTAAWQSGHPALCKIPCKKKTKSFENNQSQLAKGIIDILVHISNETELWIEAKKPNDCFDVSENSENPASQAKISRCFWAAYESSFQKKLETRNKDCKTISIVFCSFSLRPEYYQGADALPRRQARAQHVNLVLNKVILEDPKSSFCASYFDVTEKTISDELDNRPFGFAVLGHFGDVQL